MVLQDQVLRRRIHLKALCWEEHGAAGHTPFRKDCAVCQEAAARDFYRKRSKLPARAGVLSLGVTGPFKEAPDLHSRVAKYLLVGAFTWVKGLKKAEGEEEDSLEAKVFPS